MGVKVGRFELGRAVSVEIGQVGGGGRLAATQSQIVAVPSPGYQRPSLAIPLRTVSFPRILAGIQYGSSSSSIPISHPTFSTILPRLPLSSLLILLPTLQNLQMARLLRQILLRLRRQSRRKLLPIPRRLA
jgi:hypothetical protein